MGSLMEEQRVFYRERKREGEVNFENNWGVNDKKGYC